MTFGKRNVPREPIVPQQSSTVPIDPRERAVHHARLAGGAAMEALPELKVPWRKLSRIAYALTVVLVLVSGTAFLGYRHINAEAASAGIHPLIVTLLTDCRLTNRELAARDPLDCAKFFNPSVADRLSTALYWQTFTALSILPDEIAAFGKARSIVAARMRQVRSTTVADAPASENRTGKSLVYEPHFSISAMCQRKWPNNYTMEDYCVGQQEKAQAWSKGRRTEDRIAIHCVGKWSADWVMYQYCVQQEENARDRIGR